MMNKDNVKTIMSITVKAQKMGIRTQLDCLLDLSNMLQAMDFNKLLNTDQFTFVHDIDGIARNLDHETYELKNCFLPRCAICEVN